MGYWAHPYKQVIPTGLGRDQDSKTYALREELWRPKGPRAPSKSTFTIGAWFARLRGMLKKALPLLLIPLLLMGCRATFTNLTPEQQFRNTNNLYSVEVALDSRQQSLRWESIKPQIVVGMDFYPMRPTLLMTNRWEGLVPVPSGTNLVHYRYKFDYQYNAMGNPKPDSALSPEYTLRIIENK
jgi:hypothetical protein